MFSLYSRIADIFNPPFVPDVHPRVRGGSLLCTVSKLQRLAAGALLRPPRHAAPCKVTSASRPRPASKKASVTSHALPAHPLPACRHCQVVTAAAQSTARMCSWVPKELVTPERFKQRSFCKRFSCGHLSFAFLCAAILRLSFTSTSRSPPLCHAPPRCPVGGCRGFRGRRHPQRAALLCHPPCLPGRGLRLPRFPGDSSNLAGAPPAGSAGCKAPRRRPHLRGRLLLRRSYCLGPCRSFH